MGAKVGNTVLAAILLAALALRLYALGRSSFWFDERFSVIDARGHVADFLEMGRDRIIDSPDLYSSAHQQNVLTLLRAPSLQGPVYPLVLRAWMAVFGRGDVQIRLLSVAASMAALLLLFDLGRTLSSPGVALWACALMAVAQPQIQYAQEARDYALLLALGLGAASALARLHKLGYSPKRAAALGASLCAMLLTHYFAIGVIAGLAVWAGLFLRGRALRAAIVAGSASAMIFIVFIVNQASSKPADLAAGTSWLRDHEPGHLARTLARFALTPMAYLNEPGQGSLNFARIGVVILVLPFVVRRQRPAMLFCGLYLLGGIGLVGGIDLWRGTLALNYVRYVLVASPAMFLMLAILFAPHRLGQLALLVALIGCILALPAAYDTGWKGEWRELGMDIAQHVKSDDLLIIVHNPDTFLSDPADTYQGISFYSEMPRQMLLLDHTADEALLSQIRAFRRVWLVVPGSSIDPAALLPGWNPQFVGSHHFGSGLLYQLNAIP